MKLPSIAFIIIGLSLTPYIFSTAATRESGETFSNCTPENLHSGITAGATATSSAEDVAVAPAVIPEWRFSGVQFENVSPDSLVAAVEKMYGVKLNPMIIKAIDGNFTGSLPDDDLYASLRILSRVYGFEMPFTVKE